MTDFTPKDAFQRIQERAKQAQHRLDNENIQQKSHLTPTKHPQQDFFIADIFDVVSFRSDMESMAYPLFALKAGDTRAKTYYHDGINIAIKPNTDGMATIHDKDIWIYCISKLSQAIYEGKEVSRTVRFNIYDYLKTTNRLINGRTYELAKEALNRLKGTTISIESENRKERIAYNIGLVESTKVIEEKDGRMVRVEVTLPEWLYQSVLNPNKLLKISPDYFRLRKPLDRRIYELARKHCGNQKEFKISLDLLYLKSGSTAPIRNFKIAIKSLAYSNELPDYSVEYDSEKDQIIFKNRSASTKKIKKGF